MKKLAIFSLAFALGLFGITAHAHADTVSVTPIVADQNISAPVDTTVSVPADPNQDILNQITSLKTQEQEPATGLISKFFIHLKIRQLENKLNLQKALQ